MISKIVLIIIILRNEVLVFMVPSIKSHMKLLLMLLINLPNAHLTGAALGTSESSGMSVMPLGFIAITRIL